MKFLKRTIVDVEVEDIEPSDYPDFCDAWVSAARWEDTGEPLSEPELEELNDNKDLVYEAIMKVLY
jgi:hypothetical protein